MRLSLHIFRSADPGELAKFYQALGFAFKLEKHGKGPEHYAASGDGFTLEIYPGIPSDGITGGFTVRQFDDVLEKALAHGGKVARHPDHAVVTDPSGNRFIISRS